MSLLREIVKAIETQVKPLRVRVLNTVTRAIVKLVDDSKAFQELQVTMLDGETRSDVERVQQYGFTSKPLEGAEAIAVCVGGRRDHAVVIAVDDRRHRIGNLESGEVAVYTDQGDKIVIKRGGNIEVTASTKVLITAPLVETSANLKVGGTLEVIGATQLKSTVAITGAATMQSTLGVTGTLTGATINGSEISDGGKVLGTHTHDTLLSGGPCSAGGVSGGTVTSGAPN